MIEYKMCLHLKGEGEWPMTYFFVCYTCQGSLAVCCIRGDLTVPEPWIKTRRFGSRSFRVSGPVVWNLLPVDIRNPELSLERFIVSMLKTHLFRVCLAALTALLWLVPGVCRTFTLISIRQEIDSHEVIIGSSKCIFWRKIKLFIL